MVPAPLVPGMSPFSFGRSSDLIEAGYRLTSSWLTGARPVATRGPADGVEALPRVANLQDRTPGR
jgi:hypothetical protein